MRFQPKSALLALFVVAACDEGGNPLILNNQPLNPGAPVVTDQIPADILGDIASFEYDHDAGTLTVTGLTLDENGDPSAYARAPGLDTNGYIAFIAQDDPLDRHVTALVLESANAGAVRGGVIVTGGLANRYFGGTYYERDGGFDPAQVAGTTGLVSYAGTYVGLTNIAGDGGTLLPVPVGTDPALVPTDAAEVTGSVFLNADFSDNAVEGAVFDRELADSGLALPSIVFVAGTIDAEGYFTGAVEYDGVVGTSIGSYGGVFGGQNSESVAGGVFLGEFDGEGNPLNLESEEERGVFVLDQCGTPGANAAICDEVNPTGGF